MTSRKACLAGSNLDAAEVTRTGVGDSPRSGSAVCTECPWAGVLLLLGLQFLPL